MSLKQQVSKNIRKLRKKAGFTQEQLALKAKMNPYYVARLENNPQNLTLDVIERLAAALGCSVGNIIGTKEKMSVLRPRVAAGELDEALKLLKKANKAAVIIEEIRDKLAGD